MILRLSMIAYAFWSSGRGVSAFGWTVCEVMMSREYKFKSRVVANWDKIPLVEGRVSKVDKLSTKEIGMRKYIEVETAEGAVQVFESSNLEGVFTNAQVGDYVKIQFLGMVETKKGRTMRQFRSEVWTDDSAPAIAPVVRRSKSRGKSKDVASSK